jgi:hypothetical protein
VANITLLRNNLSAGEISPKQMGRVEGASYQNGCQLMENYIPLKGGGCRRLPGTYWRGYAITTGTVKARTIPFPALAATYAVELSNLKARFWKLSDHTLVTYTGPVFELATTITEAELFEVQYRTINGELYIVHHSHAVQKIAESTPAPFAISTPTFTGARTFAAAGAYPSVISSYAGRLVLGATDNEPTVYLLSRSPVAATGAYRLTDFTTGTNPDDAIVGFANDAMGSKIKWITANRRVAAGLDYTTWMEAGGIPTAANFYLSPVGYRGSAALQAAVLENSILYVSAPTPQLHMMIYSNEGGGLVDVDLTRDYDHILKPAVVDLAPMVSPEGILWMVRSDGQLVSATIDTTSGGLTVGFSRHLLADGGLVESVCVLRTTLGDEVWLVTNRGGLRSIETFIFTEDDDFTEIHYVDAGIQWEGTSTYTVSGLSHLEGKTVHAIANGASMPAVVVASGVATYTKAFTKIHVGLPHQASVQPTRPEIQVNATWQGKKKAIEQVILRVFRSYAGKAGQDETTLQTIPYTGRSEQPMGNAPAPITDDLDVPLGGTIDTNGAPLVVQDEPFPFTVLAMMTRIKILET